MKVMIVLENIVMDGVKRASTVLGNDLVKHYDVSFYTLADAPAYFELDAPLLIAPRPTDPKLLNFFGSDPYTHYHDQIADLITTIRDQHFQTVILPAGLTTSFAPLIKRALPDVNLIGWMHNNYATYMEDYYVQMQAEFEGGLQAVDTLVTLTESDLNSYKRFNPRTVKIYNPLTLVPTGEADLNAHRIAFTGRIAIAHKGIDFLLEAAASLPDDWKIAIAGAGTDEDMKNFYDLIDYFNVSDKLIYQGPLKDKALRDHYRAASIFVSTSRWEGMTLVIGEAMASGLPVVAMENTGSREYLGNNDYGLLTKAQDVPDFVANLKKMINQTDLRQHYAHQSLERASHFSPENIVSQWMPIIEHQPTHVSIAG